MSRVMGDSAQYLNIPGSVQVAAFYGNGAYAVTIAQAEARFPHAKYGRCWIDVLGTLPSAQVRDWETGDKGGSLEQWVIDHNKASGRKDAVIYCNVSTIPEVRQLTGTQVLGTDYFLWVATLDGTLFGPAQYRGVIANQIKGAQLTKGDWDESLVFDASFWLPVAPPAPKPAAPKVTQAQAKAAIASAMTALATLTVGVTELPE